MLIASPPLPFRLTTGLLLFALLALGSLDAQSSTQITCFPSLLLCHWTRAFCPLFCRYHLLLFAPSPNIAAAIDVAVARAAIAGDADWPQLQLRSGQPVQEVARTVARMYVSAQAVAPRELCLRPQRMHSHAHPRPLRHATRTDRAS